MTESRHIKRIVPFSSDKHPNDEEDHMAPNSASGNLDTKPPRSPAERLRLYREGIRHRPRRVCFEIKMNDARIEALVKRGYLKPSERDDTSAITQAINLFIWDLLGAKIAPVE